jgi:ParB/RepB/Spo0J family partition protein
MNALPQSTIVHLRPEQIQLRGDARSINADRVNQLADSISDVGLQSPIVVRPAASGNTGTERIYELLTGNHRYAALQKLKTATIPAIIADADDLHAEIIAIDENLCRENLSPAQEASAIARRKEIYEKLHPETSHGGNRKSSRQFGDLKSERFTKATSAVTGRGERSVQRCVTRAEKIGRAALQQIEGTSLDSRSKLDALATLPPAERESAIKRAVAGESVSLRSKSPDLSMHSGDLSLQSGCWRAEFRALMKRTKFRDLMQSAPTEQDREWAAQEAGFSIASRAPDIPSFLDRRTPKA